MEVIVGRVDMRRLNWGGYCGLLGWGEGGGHLLETLVFIVFVI